MLNDVDYKPFYRRWAKSCSLAWGKGEVRFCLHSQALRVCFVRYSSINSMHYKGSAWVPAFDVTHASGRARLVRQIANNNTAHMEKKHSFVGSKVMPNAHDRQIVYSQYYWNCYVPGMRFLIRIRFGASDFDRIFNQNKCDRHACTVNLAPVDMYV